MTADKVNNLIWVEGGAFQDATASYYYYNDIFAFDPTINLFVPVKVYGVRNEKTRQLHEV